MDSAALAGAAFLVGVVVGWLLHPSRRAEVPAALVASHVATPRTDAVATVTEATLNAHQPCGTDTPVGAVNLDSCRTDRSVCATSGAISSGISPQPLSQATPVAPAGPGMQPPPVVKRKERETTVLVCGFGSAPADADVPANVLRCLTDLHEVLSGIVGDEGGTVDRFAGDRLIAVFSAKRRSADHAGRAVEAAKRIASNVGALSRRLRYDLPVAIGIHGGSLPLDDRGHVDAAAIGDAIDVAGRIEVYAKGSAVTIALTESVAERAGGHEAAFVLVGQAAVGSEGLPVSVFTPRLRA